MLYTSSIDFSSNARMVRIGNEVIDLKENINTLKVTYQPLCTIKDKEGSFFYQSNETQGKSNSLYDELKTGLSSWFVLKNIKNYENDRNLRYQLTEGDVLKIGRVWLRIKKIQRDNGLYSNASVNNAHHQCTETSHHRKKSSKTSNQFIKTNNNDNNDNDKKQEEKSKPKTKQVCRICYGETKEDEGDPLIQPCICSGTMKYIHYSCLKTWIHSRICLKASMNTNCITYIITKIECELCKTALPDFVKHNGDCYELLNFNQSFENYIVFETISIDNHGNRYLYYVNFNEDNKITIGRGHEATLVTGEISVSRIHCIITKIQRTVYLEDNISKFGTLVLIQSPLLRIIQGLPLAVQIGRTHLNISYKEHFNFFSCCGSDDNDYDETSSYDKENMKQIDNTKYITVKEEVIDDEDEEAKANCNCDDEKTVLNGTPFLKLEVIDKEEIEKEYVIERHHFKKRKVTLVNEANGNRKDDEDKISNHNTNVVPVIPEEELK